MGVSFAYKENETRQELESSEKNRT